MPPHPGLQAEQGEETRRGGARIRNRSECGHHTLVTWQLVFATMHLSRGVVDGGMPERKS